MDLLSLLVDAMVQPFYARTFTLPVGRAPILTDDARYMVQHLNQEQMTYALQQMQREGAQDMTSAGILRKLEHIHRQDKPGMKTEEAWA